MADTPEFGEIGNIDDLVELYVDTLQSWIDVLPQSLGDAEPAPGSNREILLLLARAQAEWLTSGLRYGRQVRDLMAAGGFDMAGLAAAAKAMAEDGPADLTLRQLALIDKARGFLRQVAEASLSEAEALRSQLLEIEAELRELQGGAPEGAARRNVRAKP